jgi:hypothetical protein
MSDNAIIYKEAAQNAVAMVALTDSGDQLTFESADDLWSNKSGYAADVKPNGMATGGVITPGSASDQVAVAASTVYLAGVLTSVAADAALAVGRPDSSYLLLSFAELGYTEAVVGDIGETVSGTVTGDSGTLVAYDNTARQWIVDPGAGSDFDNATEGITIGGGTGAGTLNAVGVEPAYMISSITIDSSGALAVVQGEQGTAFSATRGALGGPQVIPVGSVELGWVRYSSSTSASVLTSEIRQVIGTSKEMYNYPNWTVNRMSVENGVLGNAGVTFDSALPLIHTGGLPKRVYASYYTPEFAEIPDTTDFVPPETTHSTSSTQIYGKVKGSSSSSLNQGSFTAYLGDGISDSLISDKNEFLFFKFKQNRLNDAYILCQGTLGVTRAFPADDDPTAQCTISASVAAVEVTA